MALWTRVKRLRGGRSHMDSQMCFSKKPRCSSAMKIREKLLSSVSPEHKERLSGSAAQERVPSWGWHSPPLQVDIQSIPIAPMLAFLQSWIPAMPCPLAQSTQQGIWLCKSSVQ